MFEGKSWIERITPFCMWIGSCRVSKRKYPIKRNKKVLTPYSPYAARIRPYTVRERTVSVRGSDGYGQNVAKMPPARVRVPYIRCRLYALYGIRRSALEETRERDFVSRNLAFELRFK